MPKPCRSMPYLLIALLCAGPVASAAGAGAAAPPPSRPDVPPPTVSPPPDLGAKEPQAEEPPPGPADNLEPEITIRAHNGARYEEYRVGGHLYMIKVVPSAGPAYYLIDREGRGDFRRSDLEPDIVPPSWVIFRF